VSHDAVMMIITATVSILLQSCSPCIGVLSGSPLGSEAIFDVLSLYDYQLSYHTVVGFIILHIQGAAKKVILCRILQILKQRLRIF